jgi:hypothetical protein
MRVVKGTLATPLTRGKKNWKALAWASVVARPGRSIAKQSEGRAGEKYLPVGGQVRKLRVMGTTPAASLDAGEERA